MQKENTRIRGTMRWVHKGPDGKVIAAGETHNLITQVGDQMYGERGAGIGTLDEPQGMRLGTGTTAAAKTGAGAAIVTYVTGSVKALDSAPASSLSGSSRRITYVTTWAAGEATANGIAEAVITNEVALTDDGGSAANTVSRALISPTVNKAAGDTLEITWTHDLLGA